MEIQFKVGGGFAAGEMELKVELKLDAKRTSSRIPMFIIITNANSPKVKQPSYLAVDSKRACSI